MSYKLLPKIPASGTLAADITDTTKTSVIAAGAGTARTFIHSIVVTNSHATVSTVVKIYSGTTLKWRANAAAGSGFTMSLPDDAGLQGGQGEAWYAQPETTGAAIQCSMAGYQYRQ